MKLMVCFVVGDDCTWSQEIMLPTERDSDVELLLEYEAKVKHAVANELNEVDFLGKWSTCHFYDFKSKKIIDIEILPLDDWFNQYKRV